MRIVVLDGYTVNPGDLDWSAISDLGDCQFFDRTAAKEVLRRAEGAEIVLTNKTLLQAEVIQQLHALKYVGVLATGTNVVDLEAARSRGIPVTNVPAYGTRSVAQATFALLLELTHHTGLHAESVGRGDWSRCADWSYWQRPLVELDGLVIGIIGFGRIGRAVGEIASALGMKVIAHRVSDANATNWVRPVSMEAVFRESDVVSLHCPLTPETKLLVNAERIEWMKKTAFLLNTSRGGLIDEPALAGALNVGRISGAGLDVLSIEPPPPGNPLLTAKNCIITPHLAWATRSARARLIHIAAENIRTFLAGKPQNVVN